MSPSFSNGRYTAPGAYVRFLRDNLSPNLDASYRIPAFIGSGTTSKSTTLNLTRGGTTKDSIGVTGVTSITSVSDNGTTIDYKSGIDYTLGSGADADKIIWNTPGVLSSDAFVVNDLDFGTFSTKFTASLSGSVVTDSYVVEVATVGTGSTRATYLGGAAINASITVTETVVLNIDGTNYNVSLAAADPRATVISKMQAAVGANATVISTPTTNLLSITSTTSGAASTITLTVASATLRQELGIWNGTSNTFTYTAGVAGTGRYNLFPRSTRISQQLTPGQTPVTVIPGLSFTLSNTTGLTVGMKFEVVTTAGVLSKNPLTGASYVISVVSSKQNADYGLKYFTRDEEDQFYLEYGYPSSTNTLATAVWIAFRNLAEIISVVQVQGSENLATFSQAIDKLLDKPIYYVVPLSTDPAVWSYARAHVDFQSSVLQRRERVLVCGGSLNATPFDHSDTATQLNHERVWYVAPSKGTVSYVDGTNTARTLEVDGRFAAVSVASIAGLNDPATPLTRKQIVGFIPTVTYSETQKNQMASKGVCVIDQRGSVFRVRHQLTTFANGPIESKEMSIIQLRDHVSVVLRQNIEDEFIGTKILRLTPKLVQSFVERILEGLVQQEILSGFANVKVSQNTVDPTQLDISFEAGAVYPLNYAAISFKFLRTAQLAS